uniref:Uncharacterized protein n=1 Tax=Octopus bimaculoides TaxID=37653 RepID=A0A0L8GJE8_OCTBM
MSSISASLTSSTCVFESLLCGVELGESKISFTGTSLMFGNVVCGAAQSEVSQ